MLLVQEGFSESKYKYYLVVRLKTNNTIENRFFIYFHISSFKLFYPNF